MIFERVWERRHFIRHEDGRYDESSTRHAMKPSGRMFEGGGVIWEAICGCRAICGARELCPRDEEDPPEDEQCKPCVKRLELVSATKEPENTCRKCEYRFHAYDAEPCNGCFAYSKFLLHEV